MQCQCRANIHSTYFHGTLTIQKTLPYEEKTIKTQPYTTFLSRAISYSAKKIIYLHYIKIYHTIAYAYHYDSDFDCDGRILYDG